jgi:hypothetical protein
MVTTESRPKGARTCHDVLVTVGDSAQGMDAEDGYAGAAISVGSRRRLKAAAAKHTSQCTLARPRILVLRSQAIVFNHPKAGSTLLVGKSSHAGGEPQDADEQLTGPGFRTDLSVTLRRWPSVFVRIHWGLVVESIADLDMPQRVLGQSSHSSM